MIYLSVKTCFQVGLVKTCFQVDLVKPNCVVIIICDPVQEVDVVASPQSLIVLRSFDNFAYLCMSFRGITDLH